MENRYPRLEINLNSLENNIKIVTDMCRDKGISVAGVIKGATGIPEVSRAFADNGADIIGSSRLEQLRDAKDSGIKKPLFLIRVPMLSEVADVIELCAISLNSDEKVLESLNVEARKQAKRHSVILMADLGDLREGFWDKEEMISVAKRVEDEMEGLYLAGIGTNLGCYGSVLPTSDKLQELVSLARKVEETIGRKLDVISGGATSSMMRVVDNNMPEGINSLRIGEAILLNKDLPLYYGYEIKGLKDDVFSLHAEVIEVRDKPTHPQGELGVDAFGNTNQYEDRGIRRRALVAVGKVDYGDIAEIFPIEEGITILGASSDHTILDVEDYKGEINTGDIVKFDINYASLVYLSNCRNVHIGFVRDGEPV